jgi:hypothetical protein
MVLEIALVNVGLAFLLAFIVEVLVEHFVGKPLEEKLPKVDRWWLIYVALAVGSIVSWLAGLNVFGDVMPELLGRILTCVIVGGGSELVHEIVSAAGDLAAKWASPVR